MDEQRLNAHFVELVQHPDVRLRMWQPRMFWDVGSLDDPLPEDLKKPKFDLRELEVVLSAAAMVQPVCAEEVNAREPGRADFLIRQVRRGELPLLHRGPSE